MEQNGKFSRTKQRPHIDCNLETLKVGFERYIVEHGHLPTSNEITECLYLPSAKQIERRWGGVNKVRTMLGYTDSDFSRGEHRSKYAYINTYRGMEKESIVEKILNESFGEVYVHIEKRYGVNTRTRMDFFVYSPDGNY